VTFGGDGARPRSPIRLGLVIGQLTAGGAEGQLELLCRELDRAAVVPTVYCLSEQTKPHGVRIGATGTPLRCIGGARLTRAVRLRHSLEADRIELVHAWLYIANAYAWMANRGPQRPMITSARNCKVQGRISQLANILAFRSSRAIVANSHDVSSYIVRHYRAPRDRIRVIPNGIDVERFHPRESGATQSVGPIVTAGRLVEQKNHDLFLRAAAELARGVPEAQFLIAGEGPLRGALERQARDLGIADRVQFAGERHDVDVLLRTGSILWLTSRWEGMPNIVLEGMASGLPVIATDVGGARELIRSGVAGFVVADGDAGAFVRHSRDLLLQPAMRQRFAAAARARAEEFSSAAMVRALSELYEEVLGRSR